MHFLSLLALAGSAAAQLRGFNYGALLNSGVPRTQQDFENEFNRARNLQGTSGFTSARLFTMIQGGTPDTVSSAIPAAIATKTNLLLGLWGSGGQAGFNSELTALRNAISQYGTQFTDLVVGISVGSEDLYRITPTGIENNSGAGASPDELVSYIQQTRDAIAGTAASGKSIGHVDTWTAWVNSSNSAVNSAVDWLGFDGYPYYQTVNANGIENGESLFFESYNATVAASQGKPVWVTETGWPVSGPQSGQATASIANAGQYWKDVACRILGNVNTFWFTLADDKSDPNDISFSIIGPNLGDPLFDLSCGAETTSSSSASKAPSSASKAPSSAVSSSAAASQSVTSSASSLPSGIVTVPTAPNPPETSAPATSEVASPQPSTLVTTTSTASPAASYGSGAPSAPASSPSSSSPAAPSGECCPADLSGSYEYSHLLIPVDSKNPSKAYGTQYNGTITPEISSIFNFDIPQQYAGKTCTLVFLLPEQKDLETSAFDFNGQGGLGVSKLSQPATEQTTFENKPAKSGSDSAVASVAPGNAYTISSGACEAGARIAYEFYSTGGLNLEYFQDYNPSPIGAYITVC